MIVTKNIGLKPERQTMTVGNPVYLDAAKAPFSMHGLCEPYRRVPEDVAKNTSRDLENLGAMTAGGRIRFKTDSDYIIVQANITAADTFGQPQSSMLAKHGFNFYVKEGGVQKFGGIFFTYQGGDCTGFAEGRVRLKPGMKEITLYLPLFAKIDRLYIALREGSEILPPDDYKYKKPVVFYGSSIVHGVGATLASGAYPAVVSRMLDCDFVSLGFAGAARGEDAMINYIAGLDMSVLVYDYDHNAPTFEHLEKTHYAGYKRIRETQPDLPIIFATKVDYRPDVAGNEPRRRLIFDNYSRALAEGDKNIRLVDGAAIFPPDIREECTADNCHPNGMGYFYMAKAIGKKVKEFLK